MHPDSEDSAFYFEPSPQGLFTSAPYMFSSDRTPFMYQDDDLRMPSSVLTAAAMPSAPSPAIGSPRSNHGQSIEWTAPQGLDFSSGIVSRRDYFATDTEYMSFGQQMLQVPPAHFDFSQPKPGFVDPSLLRPDISQRPFEAAPAYPPEPLQYPASPAITSSSQPQDGSASLFPPNHDSYPQLYYPHLAWSIEPQTRQTKVFPGYSAEQQYSDSESKGTQRCPHPDCGETFKHLKAHMLTHQQERPEKCPIQTCDYHIKGFARKHDKNRHIMRHYNGHMVCGFCPGSGSATEKLFNRADVFKRHLTAVHGVVQTLPNSHTKTAAGGPGPGGKKLQGYAPDATGKCSSCSQTFLNAQDLYDHLDDCVLNDVLRGELAKTVNTKRLAEVKHDSNMMATLEKDQMPTMTQVAAADDDEDTDADHDLERHVKSGRLSRQNYPSSWGFDKRPMDMKKRVMTVFDGLPRPDKDDMMLGSEYEVRIPLSDNKAHVTALDVHKLKQDQGFLDNTTEKELRVGDSSIEEDSRGKSDSSASPPQKLDSILADGVDMSREMLQASGGTLEAAANNDHMVAQEFDVAIANSREGKPLTATGPGSQPFATDEEILFTDSGYASGPKQKPLRDSQFLEDGVQGSMGQIPTMGDEFCEEDAQTVYSAENTVAPFKAQAYISSLSRDIYGKMRRHLDLKNWPAVSAALPELTKAFALKIAQDNSSQVNRDMMYFIHKRHKEISREVVLHLEDLLLGACSDLPAEIHKADPDAMSTLEKISLWESKTEMNDPEVEKDDLFEGVGDDDEENMTNEDQLHLYDKVLLSSAAYDWFIAALRRECSLHWCPQQPRIMIEGIRQKILQKLPSGKISKRRLPPEHHVTFQLWWRPLAVGIRREQRRHQPTPQTTFSISEIVTATGSASEAQVATIEEYFNQTWPSKGMGLLRVLDGLVDAKSSYGILKDKSRVFARIRGPRLLVTVVGPAYSIAECGEQLSWLASAIHSPSCRSLVYCTPSIKDPVGRIPGVSAKEARTPRGPSSSGAPMDVSEIDSCSYPSREARLPSLYSPPSQLPHSHLPSSNFWSQDLPNPEPAHDKPRCQVGLEIEVLESPTASDLLQESFWHTIPPIPVVVRGFPVAHRPGICDGPEFSYSALLRAIEAVKPIVTDGLIRLEGHTTTLELVKRTDNIFQWHDMSLGASEGRRRCVGQSFRGGVSGSDLGNGRHFLCGCGNPSFSAEDHEDRQNNSGNTPTASASNTPTSFDACMQSISSDSELARSQDHGSPGFRLFKRVLQRLVSGYQAQSRNGPDSSDNHASSGTDGGSVGPPVSSGSPGLGRGQKRQREDTGNSEGEDGDQPNPKRVNRRQPASLGRPRYLACPFWKIDPTKHWACFLKKLTRISYVKQHLTRRHTPDYYCHRCFSIFTDALVYDGHVQDASCVRGPSARLEGISQPQNRLLSRKCNGSVEDQWFAIWDIVFPDDVRPSSVYVDLDQSEDFCLVREYSQRNGLSILVEELRAGGLLLRPDIREEELQQALRRGLDSMFEYFRLGRRPDELPSARRVEISHSRDRNIHRQPASTEGDSGIAVASQLSSSTGQEGEVLPYSGAVEDYPGLEEGFNDAEPTARPSSSNHFRHAGAHLREFHLEIPAAPEIGSDSVGLNLDCPTYNLADRVSAHEFAANTTDMHAELPSSMPEHLFGASRSLPDVTDAFSLESWDRLEYGGEMPDFDDLLRNISLWR